MGFGIFQRFQNLLKFWLMVRFVIVNSTIAVLYQLPQTILGFCFASVLLLLFGGDCFVHHGVVVVNISARLKGAVSFGFFIVGPETLKSKTPWLVHEYGHSVQSKYWGPFYLLVIGMPSVMSFICLPKYHKYRWFEKDANLKGMLAHDITSQEWNSCLDNYPLPIFKTKKGNL